MAAGAFACALLTMVAVPAARASYTVGQVAPGNPPAASCAAGTPTDHLQPTSAIAAGYFAKSAGFITSWTTNAAFGVGQVYTMKIFRRVSGDTFRVVGLDGPKTLAGGLLNTFQSHVAVQPGDILGFNESGSSNACTYAVFGDSILRRGGNLGDGSSGAFNQVSNLRLNISAVLEPSNSFSVGGVAKDRGSGTATVIVNVPNPGHVQISGKGVTAASAGKSAVKETTVAGPVDVRIRATGQKRAELMKTGHVKVKPKITYTPFSGDPAVGGIKVKLRARKG